MNTLQKGFVVGFFVVIFAITMIVTIPVYCEETIQIFDDETFEVAVDDTTKEAGYELNFTFLLPPYKNATLFLEYTNMIGETVIERSVIFELSVFVGDIILLTEKYSPGVQALSLEKTVLVQPDVNHTGRLFLIGTSEHKLMGTINMHVEYTVSGSNGIFNWNPFDINANWQFYAIMIFSVGIGITAIVIRKRRRGAEEV